MTQASEFKREQRGVALAMAAALAVTITSLGIVMTNSMPLSAPFDVRLQSALRADLFVLLWLMAAIGNVARLRFFSQSDIAGSGVGSGTEPVRIANAILQNTLEQVFLAIGAHLIVTSIIPWSIPLVHTLVGLFVIGRLLFWLGYRHGAKGRAFGFALSFYPTALTLIGSATALLIGSVP
jgi:hypothetical protein